MFRGNVYKGDTINFKIPIVVAPMKIETTFKDIELSNRRKIKLLQYVCLLKSPNVDATQFNLFSSPEQKAPGELIGWESSLAAVRPCFHTFKHEYL